MKATDSWSNPPLDDGTDTVGSLLDWLQQAQPWRSRGACNGVDPNLFFPERGETVREAKAICAGCPVRQECMDWAFDNGEHAGIWGGTTERDRRRMRRDRPKPPTGPNRREARRQRMMEAVQLAELVGGRKAASMMGLEYATIAKWMRMPELREDSEVA